MAPVIFENARLFDGVNAQCREGMSVSVIDKRIGGVSPDRIGGSDARRVDVGGRTLMPGLINLHVHAYASSVSDLHVEQAGVAYRIAHAAHMLSHALDCGFTIVRDIGGGDRSLATNRRRPDPRPALLLCRADHLGDRWPWRFAGSAMKCRFGEN